MKFFLTSITLATACLMLLTASCQQTNKGEGRSKWHLKSPPGSAAGYGHSPLDTNEQNETTSPSPASDSSKKASTPDTSEPATGGNGSPSSIPVLTIEPPPSAAGYGSPLPDAGQQKETPTDVPTNDADNGEATMRTGEPPAQQPASGDSKPFSSWEIKPPPSAAGYGK